MGLEASKEVGPREDPIDAYIDRDGCYIVNKHRRTATVTTIDIGMNQDKDGYSVSYCDLFRLEDCNDGDVYRGDVLALCI
jgi:hypothetical protein